MAILFLTLKTFSDAGGIQKVSRIAGKVFSEFAAEANESLQVYSIYDAGGSETEPYFPRKVFKGFSGNKISFFLAALLQGMKSRVIILSHINLLPAGYLVKLFSKKTRLILIAHGIEAWQPPSFSKKKMLDSCDTILPVSRFTRDKMLNQYSSRPEIFTVLSNCIDPLLPAPAIEEERCKWRAKYGIAANDIVLMTLCRLRLYEKNKGYDKVLMSVKALLPNYPHLKYLLVGKYDAAEKQRLDAVIDELGITGKIVFTGFIPDEQLAYHYNIADLFIMPSEKEGFGISFIEAMYYNKPVIAGNRDGSVDALLDGRLGTLVDPQSQQEITDAIERVIRDVKSFIPNRELLMEHFGYEVYKRRWREMLVEG